MLNIRRKRRETIHIGKTIEIKVLDLFKGSVLLGIKAPKDVEILRGELLPKPDKRR
jgi:carbon storage regulator